MSKDAEPKAKLSEGTIITCPKCKKKLLQLKEDMFSHDVYEPGMFNALEGQDKPDIHKPMNCTNCDEPFAKGMIHTEKGWV